MTDFAQRAQAFFQQAQKKYTAPFTVEPNVLCCGKHFPLTAGYEKQGERYLFGIKSDAAKLTVCGEKCFFDCCENLDEQSFAEYKQLLRQLQDAQVPSDNPEHEYTLISFVLVTAGVSRKVQRMIRRTDDYRQYKGEQYGWSALRLCVYDMESDCYYYNGMGKGVYTCLTRDSVPQERKKRFGLF